MNETSYHGAGAIAEIATEAKNKSFQKAFVCSDPDLIKFGVTGKVTKVLEDADWIMKSTLDIKANPTIENVKMVWKLLRKQELIISAAIGGGSSMDTSKAIGIIIYKSRIC